MLVCWLFGFHFTINIWREPTSLQRCTSTNQVDNNVNVVRSRTKYICLDYWFLFVNVGHCIGFCFWISTIIFTFIRLQKYASQITLHRVFLLVFVYSKTSYDGVSEIVSLKYNYSDRTWFWIFVKILLAVEQQFTGKNDTIEIQIHSRTRVTTSHTDTNQNPCCKIRLLKWPHVHTTCRMENKCERKVINYVIQSNWKTKKKQQQDQHTE